MRNGGDTAEPRRPGDAIAPYLMAGLTVVLLLVGGLAGWAATSELAGAVLAQGTVVVDSNVKKIQHPTGGIIGEIRVKDGDTVQAGDLLLRLDETAARAALTIITKQLDELAMRQTRLKAERDGVEVLAIPQRLSGREHEADVAEVIVGERNLFDSRRAARTAQRAQLRERIVQLNEEVRGQSGQHEAKAMEAELVAHELKGLEELEGKRLTTTSRLTTIRRDYARLDGERSQLIASMAQARGRIAEIELQLLQLDQDLKTEVVKELRDIQSREAELIERRIAAEDQLRRIEIRSPQSGVVHQLAVHTVGGVISPSEPVMLIVPAGDRLVIEARVLPHDIEQVQVGALAVLRLTAFNQRTTPELMAVVDRVSADLTREPQTGQAYFLARLTLTEAELAKLAPSRLVPGMPADVQIRTQSRTALSYLLRPLQDQFTKAFRER